MVKLLILADDFTGALDTGVQFAKRGIETQVVTGQMLKEDTISPAAEVLVIDLETRPLAKEQAYQIVKEVTGAARKIGIPAVFKKTDSALRGNIGAELAAVLDAGYGNKLFFIPAFPDVNRITVNGIHYIDGEPLENSVFKENFFDVIKSSSVPDIIRLQTDYPIINVGTQDDFPKADPREKTIYLFDAESRKHLIRRLTEMKACGQMILMAGCAGLADCLTGILELTVNETVSYRQSKGVYMACGSLNPITREQLEYAQAKGGYRIHLTREQKLDPKYYDTAAGSLFIDEIKVACDQNKLVMTDTFDMDETQLTSEYAKDMGMDFEQVRYIISECHGRIVKELLLRGMEYTILMTGGDTLMGFMKQIGCNQLHPICEIGQGAVLSELYWQEREIQVISKSGGYGEPEIIMDIVAKVTAG